MWRRLRSSFGSERGSAMVVVVFFSIMILLMAGAAVDLGLYYAKLQRASNVANSSKALVQKMMAVYIADMTYASEIEYDIMAYADSNGLDTRKLQLDITRGIQDTNDTKRVTFYFTFIYKDTYECLFLPLFGINELLVDINITENLNAINVHLWEPGDPYVTWRPDRTGSTGLN